MFSSVRTALRRAAPQQARNASSAADGAAQKAQAAAASAQATASKALSGVQSRLASLLGAYREPVVYNAQVAKELVKQVYIAEKLAPPSFAQVSYTFRQFASQAPHASFWQKLYTSGQWKYVLIVAVEAYGIFSIGEMIGRRSVVGYKLDEDRYAKLT
ncbi:hypothetical protein JCM10450v2_002517 [Rhodotorula kratochvilovae]